MSRLTTEACQTTAIDIAGATATLVTEAWESLARPAPSGQRFDPAMTESLPEPARRWLTHVIAPGTPLARAAIVHMHGQIRLRRWLPFRAVQVQAPPAGYIWAARVHWGPVWVGGYDRYSATTGEMRWRLFSRIPVMAATGSDTDRSAAGRVALDAMLVPTAWLQPTIAWRADGNDAVVAEWSVDNHTLAVALTIAPNGALRSVSMPRWAQPAGHSWGEYPCGGTLDDETDFDGIKLGRRMRAGYFYGSREWDSPSGEFFRAEITNVHLL